MLNQRQKKQLNSSKNQKDINNICIEVNNERFNSCSKHQKKGKIIRKQIANQNIKINDEIQLTYAKTAVQPYNSSKIDSKYKSRGNIYRQMDKYHRIQGFSTKGDQDEQVTTKYSTVKKQLKEKCTEQTRKQYGNLSSKAYQSKPPQMKREIYEQSLISSGNGKIQLKEGWYYQGQYVEGLFHGYGQLFNQNNLIYSGKFQYGYFHGYGKLLRCDQFERLINMQSLYKLKNRDLQMMQQIYWEAYFGEFNEGHINGSGQLWINEGKKIISVWSQGQSSQKYYVLKKSNL